MFDVALLEAGGQIALATSSDEDHPPENIIDGKMETFWASTGLFPQEFVLSFTSLMNVQNVKIHCYQVKGLRIERSVQQDPTDFELVTEKELVPSDASLQTEEFTMDTSTARHLRVIISSGYDHFVSVHRVNVSATAVHE